MKKNIIVTAILFSVTMVLSKANVFQEFMPRSVCMYQDQALIWTHLLSDATIFIAYIGIGIILLILWNGLKKKGFPFTDFFWQFGGFIFFCGLTHLVGVVNIYVTYYWLDGIIKLGTAWFSILTFISLARAFETIKNLPTPKEFERLRERLDRALKELNVTTDNTNSSRNDS